MSDASPAPILTARQVSHGYPLPRTALFRPRNYLDVLKGIDFEAFPGESVGIVGESGSGKSTLTRILVADERPTEGVVELAGRDVWSLDRDARRELRRDVQVVLQNPRSSFDPRMTIGRALSEPLRALRVDVDPRKRIQEVLDQVGLATDATSKYMHEFSGGQLQRIAIARALMPYPKVIIADEPVSALDVSIQAQVLNLLKDMVAEQDLTLVLVSHDLSVVAYTTDRVAVMSDGGIVEVGRPLELFTSPQAPATRALVDAVLTVDDGLMGKALA